MEINNLEKIKSLLTFESEDDFYHLQILKRKKEHPELGSNSQVVKTYYIKSLENLDYHWEEMKLLANFHIARVMINLNKRSFEKIAFHTLKKVTDQIMNKDWKSVRKSYTSVCGGHSNSDLPKWIIDVDVKDMKLVEEMTKFIDGLIPIQKVYYDRESKLFEVLETKSGYHMITTPFHLGEFKGKYPDVDVQKDNPTVCYFNWEKTK